MTEEPKNTSDSRVTWWMPVVFAALAGGMAWGIRGQYGHESGAMIAGLLVSLTLVYLLGSRISTPQAMRTVAWTTIAMGFGGSMTYGQTVGLTHDGPLVGNWAAASWGMLGLAIKGGIWIGFAGVFLGMGLSGVRYRYLNILFLMLGMIGVYFLGVALLNSPHDPAHGRLPLLYFSDHWRWEPGAELKPRPECWGGLLFALVLAGGYAGWWCKDRLARNMVLWGFLGGALGFPLGQSLQAFHAWNPTFFSEGPLARLDQYMNWWNMMETGFGTTMGGVLGLGLWLNRKKIVPMSTSEVGDLPPGVEWLLLAVHVPLLVWSEWFGGPVIDAVYDLGLMMALIPMVAVAGGRWWPFLQALPITLIPIAGKTVKSLIQGENAIDPALGWCVYFIIPILLVTVLAFWTASKREDASRTMGLVRRVLIVNTWVYFLLNYAYFRYPWPWVEWTGRTPNGIIFTACAIGLTVMALSVRRREADVEGG